MRSETMPSQQANEAEIFNAARRLKAPTERAAYLDEACQNDAKLLARVEAMLRVHDQDENFLTSPALAPEARFDADPLTERPGTLIGRYKLLEIIGEGGFGDVYMAEQHEPVRRNVALKIIKPGMDTRQVIARFEAERQALALMDHANIAKVLDAGATNAGRPYFVMDLVKGPPITAYCDANNLTIENRLKIFIDVCRAVQHAHQKGIIHRDLKPTNVLVTQDNWRPVPKIIDFGVAKATQQRLTEKTLFTEHRQLVGTPEYMSPEQATFGETDVDTRSDVYSLGVLLYELIAGTTPFETDELRSHGYDEICRVIREVDPTTPSRKLSAFGNATTEICKHRQVQPAALRRLVKGDLDWIVMKCLEKDRTRRYDSALDLAQDLERCMAGTPIEARPISNMARASRWCKRNPILAGLSAAVTALLLLVSIGGPIVAVRQSSLATREARARKQAQVLRDESMVLAAELAFDRALSLCDEGKVGEGMLWLVRSLEIAPASATALRQVTRANLNAWRSELHPLDLMLPHPSAVHAVSFSPDGDTVLTGGQDGVARLWDAHTGELVREFIAHSRLGIGTLAFSPDGQKILTGSSGRFDLTARLWDVATGEIIHELIGHERPVRSVAFSPDGQMLLTGSSDKTARLWDAGTGKLIHELVGHMGTIRAVRSVAFSPDSQMVLTASMDQTARLWDVATGKVVHIFPHVDAPRASVAFSPDGKVIFTGTDDKGRAGYLWDVNTRERVGQPFLDQSVFRSAVFSQDGALLLTTGGHDAQLWSVATGAPIGPRLLRYGSVSDVALSPTDDRFVIGCADFSSRILRVAPGRRPTITIQPPTRIHNSAVALSPDGQLVATGTWWSDLADFTARIWNAATGELIHELKHQQGSQPARHQQGVTAVAFSPDSQMVLSGDNRGARLWDAQTGRRMREFAGHVVWAVAFSPDGNTVVTGGLDSTARVWRCDTGEPLGEPLPHQTRVLATRFSPDGKTFVTASRGAQLWDATTRLPSGPPLHHEGEVSGVTFSPDGSLILTGCSDGAARLWETSTRRMIGAPMQHRGSGVAFSPDGRWMLTGSQLRDVTTRKLIGPSYGDWAHTAMFTPDGSRIVTGGEDIVSIWDFAVDAVEGDVDRIRLWVEVMTGLTLSAEGDVRMLDAPSWQERRDRLDVLGGPPG